MRYLLTILLLACFLPSCKLSNDNSNKEDNRELHALFENYYEEWLKLFPLSATAIGDTRYNNQLPVDFTDLYREKLKTFFQKYLTYVSKYDPESLNENDRINYKAFRYEVEINMRSFRFNDNYIPFQQFWGLPLTMGQLGSGDGNQPFKTVKDYDDWLQRASKFGEWADSAIAYFRKGMENNYVLPRTLVIKMIPQMAAMREKSDTLSLFYAPVTKFPADFPPAEKERLRLAFKELINRRLIPAYGRLETFLKNDYLPGARSTSGIWALPNGNDYYKFLIDYQTTTQKSPEEIYATGLHEVARIKKLQDSVKNAVGFNGDLKAFFEFMKSDKRFMPYKTPEEVIAAFQHIYDKIKPHLQTMFNQVPKTPFEIRQTEAYRAASASAEYNAGSPDGSRPGIFYVPILDPATFNTTSGMESLFLHEAIPGHHYQISLQQEDTSLPKFIRFGGNNAYVEGWALYCELLGKELGLYTDPYQYMAALGDEMHRAIRLVVDVGLHYKGMSREAAINYMMSNEAASLQYATMEIERYMAIPGQALGYKIGALKIAALRNKYQKELGLSFNLASFHDAILDHGALPLNVLEEKMDDWFYRQKK